MPRYRLIADQSRLLRPSETASHPRTVLSFVVPVSQRPGAGGDAPDANTDAE